MPLRAYAQDPKFEQAAVKWMGRFIEECSPSLLRAQIALAALRELRTGSDAAKRVLTRTSGCRLNAARLGIDTSE